MTPVHYLDHVIIGYGSDLRGDDAAGRAAAEELAAATPPNASIFSVHQLTPELAPLLARAKTAIFLDAGIVPDAGVTVIPLIPSFGRPSLNHAGDPESLLLLAETIYGHAPQAWLITIPAHTFTLGAPISASTRAAIAKAIAIVKQLTENQQKCASL